MSEEMQVEQSAETNGTTTNGGDHSNQTPVVETDKDEKQASVLNGKSENGTKKDENTKPKNVIKSFKVEIPRISSSRDIRPQKPHIQVVELEQCGLLCNALGAKRDLNKSILKIRTVELEENVKKAKKYAMEQSVRFALVKQTQQAQKQQLELIRRQQALLLMCR
jgi:hypothetical protein